MKTILRTLRFCLLPIAECEYYILLAVVIIDYNVFQLTIVELVSFYARLL